MAIKEGASESKHAEDPVKPGVHAITATRDITIAEHETGFWAAGRQWPTAVFWAVFFCIAVVMAGFDAQLVTSFYALPAFQERFGHPYKDGHIIPAEWQTALGMVRCSFFLPPAMANERPLRETPSVRSSAHWPVAGHWKNSVANSLWPSAASGRLSSSSYSFSPRRSACFAPVWCWGVWHSVSTW